MKYKEQLARDHISRYASHLSPENQDLIRKAYLTGFDTSATMASSAFYRGCETTFQVLCNLGREEPSINE